MQLTDKDGNVFGTGGLEITTSNGKPKIPIINTDITIGTTAIVGGVTGRILFEGTGNVVQESANLSWDNTNGRITVNTITNGAAAIFKNSTNGFTIYPQSTQVQVYGDYFGAGTDKPLILGTYTNRANQLTLFTSGNIGVNTSTDSGFRFDVAGTARIQSTLSISNPSFTMGGSITHSANATLVITGGPGAGGENITFGPSNRIFINAQQSRFPNGSVQIAGTLSVGNQNATSTNMLLLGGSITAASALGRGIGMDTTLVASANNDVLIGLDVIPTFTNGAFTGVSNFAARFGGDAVFTHGNRNIRVLSPTSGNGGSLSITSGSATTSGTGGDIYLNVGSGAGGPGPGRIYLGNNNGWDVCYVRGLLTINNSGPNTGSAFQVNAGGQNGLTIFWDNLTPFMQYGLVSNRQARFVNSSSYTFSSKVFINTNTDAGFNFDVNGTARVQGQLNLGNASTDGFLYSSPSVAMRFGGGQTTNTFIFTQINSGRFQPAGTTEQAHVLMTVGQAESSGQENRGSVIRHTGTVSTSNGNAIFSNFQTNTVINTTGGTTTYRGFYHNPTLTAMVGVTHYAIHTTSGRIRFENLPTSSAGLNTGELWNDAGTLKIV